MDWSFDGLLDDLIAEPPAIDADGCVTVPDNPGLGVTLDLEAAQRKYPFDGVVLLSMDEEGKVAVPTFQRLPDTRSRPVKV